VISAKLTRESRKPGSKETMPAKMDQLMQICTLGYSGRGATVRAFRCVE